MNIISWKPKPKVLVNDIDSVLDNFFQNDWSFEKRKNLDGNWVPSVDISENENKEEILENNRKLVLYDLYKSILE